MLRSALLVILLSGILFSPSFAAMTELPSWVRTTTGFWCDGFAGDYEWNHVTLIQKLMDYGVIDVSATSNEGKKIPAWIKSTACWWVDGLISDDDFISGLQFLANEGIISLKIPESEFELQSFCSGEARCFVGTVTEIIDGDTIKVDGQSIRFALVHTPERGYTGYIEAKELVTSICPVGSSALVDEDDLQTSGSYGRIIALVYCNGKNLNQAVLEAGYAEILDPFCSDSEFSHTTWVWKNGCAIVMNGHVEIPCERSYPDVCIPKAPPDLDCKDIPYRNFRVLQPDPHGFDSDKDGIGCES